MYGHKLAAEQVRVLMHARPLPGAVHRPCVGRCIATKTNVRLSLVALNKCIDRSKAKYYDHLLNNADQNTICKILDIFWMTSQCCFLRVWRPWSLFEVCKVLHFQNCEHTQSRIPASQGLGTRCAETLAGEDGSDVEGRIQAEGLASPCDSSDTTPA